MSKFGVLFVCSAFGAPKSHREQHVNGGASSAHILELWSIPPVAPTILKINSGFA